MRLVKQGYTSKSDSVCIWFDEQRKVYIVIIKDIGSHIWYQRVFAYLNEAEKKFADMCKIP